MCRNITELRGLEPAATSEEIEAAARQYVRKVSGLTKPTEHTHEAFEEAVAASEDPEAAQAIADTPATFFMADPAAMALVLTDLERDHGSIPAYVHTLGVTEAQLDHLQDLLLTSD